MSFLYSDFALQNYNKKMTYANKKEKKPAYDAGLMNEKTPNSKESPLSSASLVPPLNGGHHGCKGTTKKLNVQDFRQKKRTMYTKKRNPHAM